MMSQWIWTNDDFFYGPFSSLEEATEDLLYVAKEDWGYGKADLADLAHNPLDYECYLRELYPPSKQRTAPAETTTWYKWNNAGYIERAQDPSRDWTEETAQLEPEDFVFSSREEAREHRNNWCIAYGIRPEKINGRLFDELAPIIEFQEGEEEEEEEIPSSLPDFLVHLENKRMSEEALRASAGQPDTEY